MILVVVIMLCYYYITYNGSVPLPISKWIISQPNLSAHNTFIQLPRRHMNFACTFRIEYVSTVTKHEENKNIAILNLFSIFLKTGKKN